jgi:tetratricopeptide (TPR) repeat protein
VGRHAQGIGLARGPKARVRLAAAMVLIAGACAVSDACADADAQAAAFLERAQFWQARNREDLARDEIEKALRVAPGNAEALVMQARMQLRANRDKEAAETLERLRRASPRHPAVGPLSAALRIRGPDRDKLRQARQLVRAGRNDEAVRAYAALFPDGFPDDEIALEHAHAVAGTGHGWEQARMLFADLARRRPEDARFQVALAAHLGTRKPVPASVIASLRDFAKHPSSAVSRPAAEAWRRTMRSLDPVEESLPALREYVALNPDDSAVVERLAEVTRIVAEERRQLADPGLRAKREGWAALDANRTDEAEVKLQEAVARHPRDAEAVGGLGLVRLRQGKHDEAQELFESAARLEPKARGKWEGLARTSRFWGLLARARNAREAGQVESAEAIAREARSLDPKEPAAVAELARIYVKAGRARDAEALSAQLAPEARAEIAAALAGMHLAKLRESARAHRDAGRADAAIRDYEQAAALDADDPWLRYDLARLHAARGDIARGDALFRDLLARAPDSAEARYSQAIYLSSTGRELQALAALEEIRPADRSANMASLQRRLWMSQQGRRASAFAATGQPVEAARVLEAMKEASGNDAGLALEVARQLRRLDRDEELAALLDRVDRMESTAAQRAEAGELRQMLALRRADALVERGDYAAARPLVDQALRASPDDPDVLGNATRIALAEGRLDEAIDHERRALRGDARDGDAWRYRRLADLLDRKVEWHATGIDWLYRSGTPGKSQVSAQEIPYGWRQGWTPSGQWLLRAAPSHVAAGTLDLSNTFEASRYGSLLLCLPLCADAPLAFSETGVAIGAGYEYQGWRADVGTSPIGFPVVNAVGGVSHRGDLGPLGYTLELSRRSMPSSQLSYAGMQDPNTGRTWGGVVANGLRLNLSRDSGGDYGAWGVAGLYRLTGRNVQDNDKGELMAGLYRRFINEDDLLLTAGVTGMFWRFSENAGEYTFGHGGYYSPKAYRSLSLPVSYGMRTQLLSVWLRASVSVAWSQSRRAPFFPTDAAMQAQAEALAPVTGVDPFYEGGGNGRSYGRSFAAAAERQLAPGVFVGGRLEIERSTNYTPSRLLLYVRFTPCEPAARPVALAPEPGLPGFPY